jgi:hypothetical protein
MELFSGASAESILASQADCGGRYAQTVTISGCLMNTNGRFKLITQGQTYVLKGHQNELFSYNGMLVEVRGTVEAAKSHSPGMPMILHVTSVKKLAETCS